jgi:aspartate kinase
MKVFKFGGASVKDASGIKNLTAIVSKESDNLIIVVSAFGKTTNGLEEVLKSWLLGGDRYLILLEETYRFHNNIMEDLFGAGNPVKADIDGSFTGLKTYLSKAERPEYDNAYDQVVSFGEVWSTIIIAGFLNSSGIPAKWVDIRKNLVTDDRFRDANVLWYESTLNIKASFNFKNEQLYVTQGFIGGTLKGQTTTLGREGSDYTAAILGNILDAEKVVVWKDVPGLLNADPKWLSDAQKLDEVSYKEAVEMTFSGAKVIHPKTIKPLHNKNIPLHVKSFLFPEEEGTVIKSDATLRKVLPVFIRKEDQILISILPKDFSFVMGENLSRIFHFFSTYGIKVNLVEASAVSIDVCVDDERSKVNALLEELKYDYAAVYNEHVEILSIRHHTPEAIERIIKDRDVLLEQRTRTTVRYIVRKQPGR